MHEAGDEDDETHEHGHSAAFTHSRRDHRCYDESRSTCDVEEAYNESLDHKLTA